MKSSLLNSNMADRHLAGDELHLGFLAQVAQFPERGHALLHLGFIIRWPWPRMPGSTETITGMGTGMGMAGLANGLDGDAAQSFAAA